MAEILPLNFPIPSESAIASYSYNEIKDGVGVVEFYGFRAAVDNTPANDDYFLITNQIISSDRQTGAMSTGDEVFFDVTFNAPKIISGDVFIVLPLRNSAGVTSVFQVGIDKVSTATTSLLAYTTLETFTSGGADYTYRTFTASISRTNFKIGDKLRLKIKASTGTANTYISHDPTAGDTNFPQSGGRLSFFVPFILQT